MMENAYNKPNTSTQVRNLYSQNISYLNIKLYNTYLSFQFFKFAGKDNTGKSSYQKQGLMTTINFESAFAIYKVAKDIIDSKVVEVVLDIPCASGASLRLERKKSQSGYDTILSINKNSEIIPFIFTSNPYTVIENGMPITRTIESGLGAFIKTIEGYLTGINTERHLNKLTEDYVKSLETNKDTQATQPNQPYNSYQKKPYNNYRRYNKGNFNNYNQQPQQWEPQPTQQNMSDYNLQ